ncbi:hypothetical protein MKD33_15970, partial [Chromobacterium piscinae]
ILAAQNFQQGYATVR